MSQDPVSRTNPIGGRLLFLKRFVTSPRYLGSVTPSSHYLVNTLVGLANVAAATEVVELGPGTGPFTAGLLARMPGDGRLLCIERDEQLAGHLRSRLNDPRLVLVNGDAAELERHLAEHGFGRQAPLIVSGLPFTSLPDELRERILTAIVASLAADGDFLLYQYSYVMRKHLRRHFRTVETHWEVRNIPPAVCLRCRL